LKTEYERRKTVQQRDVAQAGIELKNSLERLKSTDE